MFSPWDCDDMMTGSFFNYLMSSKSRKLADSHKNISHLRLNRIRLWAELSEANILITPAPFSPSGISHYSSQACFYEFAQSVYYYIYYLIFASHPGHSSSVTDEALWGEDGTSLKQNSSCTQDLTLENKCVNTTQEWRRIWTSHPQLLVI